MWSVSQSANSPRIITLLLLMMVFGCNSGQLQQTDSAPNILFIYTDDQAPWAIGVSGNPQAFTPHLDQLAKQSMYFPNAYTTTPVCSPSRAGLLTSRYGYEVGIDDWINTQYPSLTGTQAGLGLSTKLPTWVEQLRDEGYTTGLIGKWHLGHEQEHHPAEHGYQSFVGFRAGGTKTVDPIIEKNGKTSQRSGLTVDILTDEAIRFLDKNQHNKFVLSLHYRAPHTQWLPVSEEDAKPYKNYAFALPNPNYPNLDKPRAKKMMGEYLSSVRGIDRNIGRLMASLKSLQLEHNTLVIFTSDHGYSMGHNGMWHKGNGHWLLTESPEATKNIPTDQRPNMYDTVLKVPTLVRLPGVIAANSTSPLPLSNLDWFPTLVAFSNSSINADHLVRGTDFKPVMTGQHHDISSEYYAAYSTLHQSRTHMRMYSDGNYKLIKDYLNRGRDEFYALADDPDESNNLIETANPELKIIINCFDDIIYQKMLDTNDPVLKTIFGQKKSQRRSL